MKLADFGIAILLDERPAPGDAAGPVRSDALAIAPGPRPDAVEEEAITLERRDDRALEDAKTVPRLAGGSPGAPPVAAGEPPRPGPASGASRLLTQTGVIIGTPLYMAPELAYGSKDAQPASDVFSLGVIAFELLTGSMPFERPPVLERRAEPLRIPPLGRHCPSLSPALAELFERCLATEPTLRPSAEEAAAALAELESSHVVRRLRYPERRPTE